jgi:hypothetical protein
LDGDLNIFDLNRKGNEISTTTFEERVNSVTDEVIQILKDLSKNNLKHISSELIAEKMIKKV